MSGRIRSLALVAVGLFAGAAAAQQYTDSVVASINGKVITQWDVAVFNASQEQSVHSMKELLDTRRNAAERLIDQEVIWAEFKERGWQVPNESVDRRLDSIVADHAGGDYRKYEEMLAAQQMTVQELRDRLRKQVAVEMFLSQLVEGAVDVPPSDVAAFYETHRDEFAKDAKCTIAWLKVPESSGDELRRLAAAGRGFADIAAACAGATVRDLQMNVADMRAEWREQFNDFRDGAVSKPFVGEGGVYLLQVKSLTNAGIRPLDEVRGGIEAYLAQRIRQQRYREFVASLRDSAYIRKFFKDSGEE